MLPGIWNCDMMSKYWRKTMKKFLMIFVFYFIGWGLFANELPLDEAIGNAARNIEDELPQRSMVLVLNFASPAETFSNYVIEELTDHLIIGRKVFIVDRQNLTAIRTEMDLQLSGDVSDESALSIGRLLGAHYIVSGSLTERGLNYRLRFRVISIETARIISSVIVDIKNDVQVARLIGGERAVQEAERRQRDEEQEAERQQRQAEREERMSVPKTANVKNNWFSLGLAGLGAGLKYERMLNSNLSLGADAYGNWVGIVFPTDVMKYHKQIGATDIGVNATVRFYPFGKAFYIGTGLGAKGLFSGARIDKDGNWTNDDWTYTGSGVPNIENDYISYNIFGFAVTPELGWRIDFGFPGGFFMDFGVKVPLMFCEPVNINGNQKGFFVSILPYIGLFGWAF